ncbi:MAG: heme ABC transporter ATP-binding protein [Dehalococcoidia bacterium]|nr:heme ABC transporter ATP-binding protein [Dehalococcoidia bacterium]
MINLSLNQVSFSYSDSPVLHHIDLVVERGEMVAVLGPNGSGKTTLIKLASGVLKPTEGEIHLDGSRLSRLKRREVAQRVAVVPQQFNMPFAFTLREVVLLGRTPFLRAFSDEGKEDHRVVQQAIALIGIEELKERFFNELSGGERQKAILAMALAQEPKLLLLDEPTAHLDINHQGEILDLVKSLNREQGLTVIGAMHDLNLAALYFDRLIFLKEGRIFADGPPAEVLTEETIREVFSASVQVMQHPTTKVPHVVITPKGSSG